MSCTQKLTSRERNSKNVEERNRIIILLYKNQVPQVDIADHFNISVDTVSRVVKNAGIEIDPHCEETLWHPKKIVTERL